jgi:hypothetical protein
MWAVWPRILSDGETPGGLIESAGRFPSRLVVTDDTLFTRSEWKERHCSSTYPQPFKIRVGSDPIKPADASLMLS